jgi:hypothetical protein
MTEDYFHHDTRKQAKLEEAIHLGYINRSTDADGVVRYELTARGMMRWIQEGVYVSPESETV